MSLGMGKFGVSFTPPTPDYGVILNPSAINRVYPAGAATSVTCYTIISGGVGPFTILWEKVSGDDITINTPTAAQTTFSASGSTSEERGATFKATVTDTGNANLETDATVFVLFIFL